MKPIILLFLFLIILFIPFKAQAFTISPTTIETETEIDFPQSHIIKVINDSPMKVKVDAFCWDLTFDKNGRKKFTVPKKGKNTLPKYIEILEKNFILEPKQVKNVTVIFNTPLTLKGGNSAIIFFNASDPTDYKFKTTLAINTMLGVTVLQSTKGSTQFRSRISYIKLSRRTSNHPLELEMKVQNTGNGFIVGTGMVSIINNKNEFLGTFDLNKKIIPPKTEMTFSREINLSLESGQYHALITYNYKDKNINIDKVFDLK